MRTLRQWYWFVQGFTSKYKKTVLASFLVALGVMLVFYIMLPKLPKPKEDLYIGVVGKYTLSQIPTEIEKRLGMGLTKIGADLSPQPALASRWEIMDGGKTYRFYLQENLKWSNGQKIKLEDLDFVIPDVTVSKIDPNIIEFKLPEPFSPFPSVLSKPVVKGGSLTAGKYTIKDIKVSGQYIDEVVLESNSDRVTYRFFNTESAALVAFRLGKIDELDSLLSKPKEADWANVTSSENPRTDMLIAVFYNTSNSLLSDKSLRQGLSYAISNKDFGQLRALSSYNPLSWAYNKTVKAYEYSEARAKELVTKATPKDSKLTIELATTPELLPEAESIKNDWEKVGVKVEMKVVSTPPSNFQAVLTTIQIPADPDQYSLWHSTQETNFTGFQSAKVDKLLEDGRQTLKPEGRLPIYHDVQRFLAEDVPATFLYHPTTYTIVRKSKVK